MRKVWAPCHRTFSMLPRVGLSCKAPVGLKSIRKLFSDSLDLNQNGRACGRLRGRGAWNSTWILAGSEPKQPKDLVSAPVKGLHDAEVLQQVVSMRDLLKQQLHPWFGASGGAARHAASRERLGCRRRRCLGTPQLSALEDCEG